METPVGNTTPSEAPEITVHPARDDIARHAYFLWEARGRPTGQDTEIWLEAERELLVLGVRLPCIIEPAEPPLRGAKRG